eukprot:2612925-Prymnesium_polylepis.1
MARIWLDIPNIPYRTEVNQLKPYEERVEPSRTAEGRGDACRYTQLTLVLELEPHAMRHFGRQDGVLPNRTLDAALCMQLSPALQPGRVGRKLQAVQVVVDPTLATIVGIAVVVIGSARPRELQDY